MIFDSHMHTELSSDSKMLLSDILDKSSKLNIGCILTEHLDLNYPVEDLFKVECKLFFEKYSKYRNDNLLLGIEVGLSKTIIEEATLITNSFPFDFILGSIHSINNIDIFSDSNKDNMSKEEFFKSYFEEMLNDIKLFDNFDSLAHIDYPCRYLHFKDNNIYLSEYENYINEIFKVLIKKNKVIELNTRRLNDKKAIDSLIPIYKRYRELGGKYVTIGSDSHNKESIGKNFDVALNIIKECNLTPVYFKERKIHIIKL